MNNPWAQPPLPSDWEVQPTYPKRSIPYYLAPLWDQEGFARARKENNHRAPRHAQVHGSDERSKVPRELREKLKKAKASRGLLKDLEEQVRIFVKKWEDSNTSKEPRLESELDSEDEEIVFVGRNGGMNDIPSSPSLDDFQLDKERDRNALVFDSLATDQGASFGFVFTLNMGRSPGLQWSRRWLVHSIATYYGLQTWSVTVGDPARREAYVGIPPTLDRGRPLSPVLQARPLWGMV